MNKLDAGSTTMDLPRQLANFLFAKHLRLIEVLLLAACLSGGYLNKLQAVEFQPDETFWIVSSVRLDKFVTGDFDSPLWIEEPFISFEVRPIPSYIVGMSQRLGGVHAKHLPEYWDWSLPREDNLARSAMPSARVLWLSRLPMAFLSILSLLGTISLLAAAHSRMAAYLFTGFSFNAYFLIHLRRSMSEAPLLLFTVLALFASYKLFSSVQENSLRKIILWSTLAGILSGLAGQSKLTGLACMAVPILGAMIITLHSKMFSTQQKIRILFMVTLVVVFTSLLFFLISYPFFYENVMHRILATFYVRGQVVASQINTYPEQTIHSNERIAVLFERIFEYPLRFHINRMVNTILHWFNLFFATFGLGYSIKQIWKTQDNKNIYLALLLGMLVCALPMLLTPLDWDRYYLYPIFFVCVFSAIGVSQLLGFGHSALWKQVPTESIRRRKEIPTKSTATQVRF